MYNSPMSMLCRVCNNLTDPLLPTQGIFKCPVCSSLNRKEIPHPTYYEDVSYWYDFEWLKTFQKSIFVWFEDHILIQPSLEIGAADGDFLNLVQKVTKCPTTYCELKDIHRAEYEFTHKLIGPVETFFPEIRKQPQNIFMVDVIEHLERPFEILEIAPVGSRLYILTADGDAIMAHDEMFLHVEHSCIITKKGFEIACKKRNARIHKYFPTPFGLSIVIIDKL